MEFMQKLSNYNLLRTLLLCSLLVSTFCSDTWADTLNNVGDLKPGTRMAGYLFSKTVEAELLQTIKFWERKLNQQQGCNERSLGPSSFILHKPIIFPQDKSNPVSGVWQYRFTVSRCGVEKVYNTIYMANNGGPPKNIPYVPGTTRASLQLIGDAKLSAITMAFLKMKSQGMQEVCEGIELVDTRLTQPPHDVTENDKTTKGVWHEEWTFSGCDFTANVTAVFIPDDSGGTSFTFD